MFKVKAHRRKNRQETVTTVREHSRVGEFTAEDAEFLAQQVRQLIDAPTAAAPDTQEQPEVACPICEEAHPPPYCRGWQDDTGAWQPGSAPEGYWD